MRPNHLTLLFYHICDRLSNKIPLFFIFVEAVIKRGLIGSILHNFRSSERGFFLPVIILTKALRRGTIISRGRGRGDYREEEDEEKEKEEE